MATTPESEAPVTDTALGLARYAGASGLLFVAGLVVSESVGEIALDVDLKPFFLPFLVIGMGAFDGRTLAASVGAAVGEGVLDLVEGYELDDPFGFLGYVLGFTVFGWVLLELAPDPGDRRWQLLACLGGAATQAVFEGVALYALSGVGPGEATLSVVGNTFTHGLVIGALPFVALYPAVRRRFGTPGA